RSVDRARPDHRGLLPGRGRPSAGIDRDSGRHSRASAACGAIMIASYLQALTSRLADGLARLPEAERAPHVAFLLAHQNPDGGFRGRDGASDLYYTAFALRSLAVLAPLPRAPANGTAVFLRLCLVQQTSVVDFFSFLYSCLLVQVSGGLDVLAGSAADWPERVATTLETFRTADGGYAK